LIIKNIFKFLPLNSRKEGGSSGSSWKKKDKDHYKDRYNGCINDVINGDPFFLF